MNRASAYQEAGADLILVHSKSSSADEIEEFARRWRGTGLVLVPAAYPELSISRAAKLEPVRMVIYGNHAIRACTRAMQEVFAQILKDGDTLAVEDQIASVREIFRLQDMDGVNEIESRFLR